VAALAHYDNNEFDEALKTFDSIADTSKILFNCGVIYATLGQHEKAVCYSELKEKPLSDRAIRLNATKELCDLTSILLSHISSKVSRIF
jgi:hypothetical protein